MKGEVHEIKIWYGRWRWWRYWSRTHSWFCLDDMCDLTAGCFSRNKIEMQKLPKMGIEDTSRIYPDYKTMVEAESKIPQMIGYIS